MFKAFQRLRRLFCRHDYRPSRKPAWETCRKCGDHRCLWTHGGYFQK